MGTSSLPEQGQGAVVVMGHHLQHRHQKNSTGEGEEESKYGQVAADS